jgi:hypothetical protein
VAGREDPHHRASKEEPEQRPGLEEGRSRASLARGREEPRMGPKEPSGSLDLCHRASVGRAGPVPRHLSQRGRCPKEGRGHRGGLGGKLQKRLFVCPDLSPRIGV